MSATRGAHPGVVGESVTRTDPGDASRRRPRVRAGDRTGQDAVGRLSTALTSSRRAGGIVLPWNEAIGRGSVGPELRPGVHGRRLRKVQRRLVSLDAYPDPDPGAGGRTHDRGEGSLGAAPSGPVGSAGAGLPRDRRDERILQRGRRSIRRRCVRLCEADDDDRARRLSDDRAADVRRLRPRKARGAPAAAATAHVRRRPGGLVDRLGVRPRAAPLHRRHARRRGSRRGL